MLGVWFVLRINCYVHPRLPDASKPAQNAPKPRDGNHNNGLVEDLNLAWDSGLKSYWRFFEQSLGLSPAFITSPNKPQTTQTMLIHNIPINTSGYVQAPSTQSNSPPQTLESGEVKTCELSPWDDVGVLSCESYGVWDVRLWA